MSNLKLNSGSKVDESPINDVLGSYYKGLNLNYYTRYLLEKFNSDVLTLCHSSDARCFKTTGNFIVNVDDINADKKSCKGYCVNPKDIAICGKLDKCRNYGTALEMSRIICKAMAFKDKEDIEGGFY